MERERDCKRKKKTKKNKERESFEERSPLKHLNGLPSSRFSPSSSTTHLLKKPKISSESAKMEPNKSRSRFGGNETPRNSTMQKSRKSTPQFITRRNSNSDAKPTSINRQRSKLSSVHGESESRLKNSGDANCSGKRGFVSNCSSSNFSENFTPVSVRVARVDESAIDDSVDERGSDDNAKTPPVEVSLSPEIQSQSQSKVSALKSVGTPVCYGAGHLLSGVSDRRKSKRRGSLRGFPGKAIPFTDENVSVDLLKSSIPSLSEASVRWHLSPCDFENDLDEGRMEYGDDLCTSSLDFLCSKSSFNGSSSRVRNNVVVSPRKAIEFEGILDESKLIRSCISRETKRFSRSMTEDCSVSVLSLGSLNSGGSFIRTPGSDSTSDAEVRLSNSVMREFDSITETLERVNLSATSEIPMWDVPCLGFHSGDNGLAPVSLVPTRLEKDADCVSSWFSNATSDDPTLSQMRMSWREGLASEVVGAGDSDCCCCLLDEQIDGDECVEEKETVQGNNSRHMIDASVENEKGLRNGNKLSPVLLDYEPCLIAGGKGKSLRNNPCAESICTDGGGLLVSDDSDWTYFRENDTCFVSNRAV